MGLYAENSPKHTLTFLHTHSRQGDTWKSGLSMNSQHPQGGSGTGRANVKLEDQPLYLRLTRTGNEFKSETSTDGKKWQGFGTHKVQGFGPVVVGPDLTHLAFEVDDMEKFAREAAAKGYPLSDGPHRTERGDAIAFVDAPEGYEIELIQRGAKK